MPQPSARTFDSPVFSRDSARCMPWLGGALGAKDAPRVTSLSLAIDSKVEDPPPRLSLVPNRQPNLARKTHGLEGDRCCNMLGITDGNASGLTASPRGSIRMGPFKALELDLTQCMHGRLVLNLLSSCHEMTLLQLELLHVLRSATGYCAVV